MARGGVRAVVFDIGKVLFDNSSDKFVETIQPHTPLKDTEIIRRVFMKDDLVPLYDQGLISSEEFLRKFKARLKLKLPDKNLAKLWVSGLIYRKPMYDLVKVLREKGYCLWIISNTNELHIKELEFYYPHFFELFHGKTYSYERNVYCLKPHPYIFCYTLYRLRNLYAGDLMPEECVFIDDLEENVKAAEALGWKTIRHTSMVRTRYLLGSYGVELS